MLQLEYIPGEGEENRFHHFNSLHCKLASVDFRLQRVATKSNYRNRNEQSSIVPILTGMHRCDLGTDQMDRW
jgi:hypothetical protein